MRGHDCFSNGYQIFLSKDMGNEVSVTLIQHVLSATALQASTSNNVFWFRDIEPMEARVFFLENQADCSN